MDQLANAGDKPTEEQPSTSTEENGTMVRICLSSACLLDFQQLIVQLHIALVIVQMLTICISR